MLCTGRQGDSGSLAFPDILNGAFGGRCAASVAIGLAAAAPDGALAVAIMSSHRAAAVVVVEGVDSCVAQLIGLVSVASVPFK